MEREDLAAQFARITRQLIAAERPLLARHDLTMWEYIALGHLAAEPAGTQLALAQAIGYDKTRLITLLDGLQRAGLITRQPDPSDRRVRNVALTPSGRERHAALQADIHAMEDTLLSKVSDADRRALHRVLAALTTTAVPARL